MEGFSRKGLRFECQQCSHCCGGGESGYVFLSQCDIERLSGTLNLKKDEFLEKYCRTVTTRVGFLTSLLEKANYDCIFLREGFCAVYEARPMQCRTYPFWERIVRDKESWECEASRCPGIGKGKLHTWEEIERDIRLRKEGR